MGDMISATLHQLITKDYWSATENVTISVQLQRNFHDNTLKVTVV
jgi:hypothetical protein